jgi:hypothetical protein
MLTLMKIHQEYIFLFFCILENFIKVGGKKWSYDNEYVFHTKEYGQGKKTYNNRVCVKGSTSNEFEVDCYRKFEEVIELHIITSLTKFFSFKCYWYNIADRGIKVYIIFWSKLIQRLNFTTSTMSLFLLSNANKFITHTLFHLERIVLKLNGYQ